ncbi:MAG: NUDIX domain-containing protein [Actinobacteria bacterium]|nr:NUDIX domain-containing protein [Actinomycetota bacterium]
MTEPMMIKHSTASAFVFCEFPAGWRLGLIEHPRLRKRMVVGGHVERDETQAEAAVREASEESGLEVRLLAGPSPALPLGYAHDLVAAPWWITEVMVPADNHLDEPHIHVDHQYAAIADSPVPASEPVHPFAWCSAEELADLRMFQDTLLLARALLPRIGSGAAAAERGGAAMLRILSAAGLS